MDTRLKTAMDAIDAIETEVGAVPKTPKRELTSVEKNAATLAAAEALRTELVMDQYTLNEELRAKQAEVYRIEERIAMVEARIKGKRAELLGELK